MEALRNLDHAWFVRIHETWRSSLLDVLMPIAGAKWAWAPAIVAFFAYASYRHGRKTVRLAIVSVFLLVASDLAANALKGEVRRLRPGRLASNPETVAGRRASFSFPSAAATNAFAAISLWSVWHPELALPLVLSGATVAYSRVYTGDHYPTDVAAGALLGCGLGIGAAIVGRRPKR